jgi:dipeptidyl aminopeptidase/acylaminoacyl peptidase
LESGSVAIDELRYGVERYLSIKSSFAPSFSPDDSRVAYLSDITGVPQVWRISLLEEAAEIAWPQQLTLGKERIGFASYARKRDALAFGVDSGGDEHFQLRMLEKDGETMLKLTDNPGAIHVWGDWSPDERSVCYSSNERNPSFFDIYVKTTDGTAPKRVYEQDGNNYPICWSPDGSAILFSRLHAPFNHDLYLLNLADGTAERLTPHDGDAVYQSASFDRTGENIYCLTDEGREYPALARLGVKDHSLSYAYTEDWELESLAANRDGTRLAFIVNEDGYSKLMIWEVGAASPRTIEVPKGVIGGLTWSNGGGMLAFSLSSSTRNSDIWIYHVSEGSVRRITYSSTCGIPDSKFSAEQLFRFRSFDGLEVPAFLYRPQADGPTPLVVYLHGGPESQFRPGFSPLIQYILQMGIAVLAPNFRGSTGYGRRYTHLDDVYNRMDTVKDSVAAVAEAQKLLPIDPRKIVAFGGSYGGFMVLGCLYSYPDMWAAGIDIVGISNFVTFLNNTGPWRRKLRIAEYGDPVKDKEFLEKISPTNNAHLIKAPLFIIHGANDPRVPIGEASQIMQTMEKLNRYAYLLVFNDEGHGLVKLNNRIEGYSKALGFMMVHLQAIPPMQTDLGKE